MSCKRTLIVFWVILVIAVLLEIGVAIYYFYPPFQTLKSGPTSTISSAIPLLFFKDITPPYLILAGKIVEIKENYLTLKTTREGETITFALDKEKVAILKPAPSAIEGGGIEPFCPNLLGDETHQKIKFSDLKINDQVGLLVISDLSQGVLNPQYKISKIVKISL